MVEEQEEPGDEGSEEQGSEEPGVMRSEEPIGIGPLTWLAVLK